MVWKVLWAEHSGKLSGLCTGLLLAGIYLFFGFWDMLVSAGIIALCYYLGKKSDRKEAWLNTEEFARWLDRRWKK